MRKTIHRLRGLPEEERRHILHIFTFAGAIILIIIWIYTLGTSITSNDTKVKIKQDLKPFTVLKDDITNTKIDN